MDNLDWNFVRSFLAVANSGSLSAAARQLGVSQSTLSRQIQELEQQVKLSLFKRNTQGVELTEQGQQLMCAAIKMKDNADQFQRVAGGQSTSITGSVRLSCSEVQGIFFLGPALKAFQLEYPKVSIELVISNEVTSLSKRDADIALRMFRPRQPDLVSRRLADVGLGLFCHRDYLAEVGPITNVQQLADLSLIGFDENRIWLKFAKDRGFPLEESDFSYKSDSLLAQYALILAGCGIGAMHTLALDLYPQLVQIMKNDVFIGPLECWIVCHREVQFNSRIRALMQFLGDWFAEEVSADMAIRF